MRQFVSRPLKTRILHWMDALEQEPREGERRTIPAVELQPRHLRHTRLLADRDALLELLPKGGVVAALGVDEGDFAAQILAVAQPRKLHLIDAWGRDRFHEGKARAVAARFREAITAGTVQIHRGVSSALLERFPDGSFDWIYIDTNHSCRATAQELRIGSRKLRLGGVLAGHDSVPGAGDGGVRYGVVDTVHEFCVREGWEIRFLTAETHRHLSFALQRVAPSGE